ncbi:cytochrome P450 4C1-like [Daktulosphaira vitifoliae]|uniref:cytochrome P450 4C1-like n=1 Tax=Daktulosphaira vitifoliae TaxID=58002 RepID=UPI0021A9A147|nr:cytochrome P450 4C1-like [Daktulosphaira vitifoliae]
MTATNSILFYTAIVVALLAILLLSSFSKLNAYLRHAILAADIPGPSGWFLIGQLPILTKGPQQCLNCLTKIYRKYEMGPFKLWLGPYLCVFVTRPEHIKVLLNHNKALKKGILYSSARDSFVSKSLGVNNDLVTWKNHRKEVTKCFSRAHLKTYIEIAAEQANVVCEKFVRDRHPESDECEVSAPFFNMTMDNMLTSVFGADNRRKDESERQMIESIGTSVQIMAYRVFNPWYMSNTIFRLSALNKIEKNARKMIHAHADSLIKTINAKWRRNTNDGEVENDEKDNYSVKPATMVETLLANRSDMTLDDIRREAVFLLMAGRDTSAFTNSCVLFRLSHHQDVQNKVFDEQTAIFSTGDPHRRPSYEDLTKMEYLERVINETLRLHTPIAVITRRVEEDILIDGKLLPAGATAFFSIRDLHKSPLHYRDPEKFDPDNFSPERCDDRHPYAFMPFSGGLRSCIAHNSAMLQLKTTVSTVVRRNRILASEKYPTVDHLEFKHTLPTTFQNGCFVKIRPRKL